MLSSFTRMRSTIQEKTGTINATKSGYRLPKARKRMTWEQRQSNRLTMAQIPMEAGVATNENEATERLWLRRLLDQSTDGVLLLLPYERIGIANALMAQNIPFIAIGDRNEPTTVFPTIGSTIWLGGYTATEYLISLGHRRIGIITGPLHLTTSRARLAGYREALERAGIPIDPALICEGSYLLGEGV